GSHLVALADGRRLSAVQIQTAFLEKVRAHADRAGLSTVEPYRRVLELWERTLHAVSVQDLALVETEVEWVMKWHLLQRYADQHRLPLDDPRVRQLDLAWHDVHPERGLFNLLSRRGQAAQVVTPEQVRTALHTAPQTTRARLRGEF